MNKIKNYHNFLESMEFSQSQGESEAEGEVSIKFPKPIKIGNKIYKDTDELEKDYKINSMSQSGNQIKIDGKDLQDWVDWTNESGEEESDEDEGMETETESED
jgi:hypothetical protein